MSRRVACLLIVLGIAGTHSVITPNRLTAQEALAVGELIATEQARSAARDAGAKAAPVAEMQSNAEPATVVEEAKPIEQARRTYLGRIVAQPMSHFGASWLIRPERNDEENAKEAFDQLGIESGMTLVDLGCGNGFWTLPMARQCKVEADSEESKQGEPKRGRSNASRVRVDGDRDTEAYQGQVLAVDIQKEMLQKLRRNAARAKIENIVPVIGEVDNPNLPANEIDLVLMVDVYHEFSHPQSMLWEIRKSLKLSGVIALLEYRAEDPDVPIKPLHKMSKAQIMKEYTASNLKLVREYNDLPWQHLMFFARDDSPLPAIVPKPVP
ncbi:Methyltransferase domain-containing protein [Neorhodopirellula lusitana]|uniref:Methyltransferase domain-containing protein n=2 Tax=Neorhodopirellula lusitana TaxID=445327 RepID=A0ABY1QDN2_9BACT|nr:Methyltransferase domain-containing protein [Neorhodopirellula lusitana]